MKVYWVEKGNYQVKIKIIDQKVLLKTCLKIKSAG
jgi:hypothetical protein